MATQQTNGNLEKYSFVLKKVELIEKTLRVYNKKDKKTEYDFDMSLQISPDLGDNRCFHMMAVNISPKNHEKDIIASFRLVFIFEISDLKNISIETNEGVILPEGLLNLLNAVVIGTMRGVIFSELRGTLLDDAILPVLDPSKFQRGG